MKLLAKVLVVLLVLGAAGAVAFPYARDYWKARNRLVYRQVQVTRGEIVQVVNSTGTVQPVKRVQIGSFVSGPIKELYVDYNSVVKKKELLAKIDPEIFEAAAARDRASCATSRAEVERIDAMLQQAIRDEKRAKELQAMNEEYISETEMDKFFYSRLSLEAQLALAKAQVQQAEGGLKNSLANLDYTNIRSPVDGVVIDRKVDQGQTVAAQFQTPELFIVAPEMEKRMHVFASVDEADIGLIREAKQRQQQVFFTVDAYPTELFEGTIYQIRVNPTSTQNVVTYTVVVEAPNSRLRLMPGMTAKLSFQIEKRAGILKIPNAGLRFFPKPEQVRPEDRELLEGTEEEPASDEQARPAETQRSAMERALASRSRNRRYVWVEEGDFLRGVEIVTGLSDSKYSEIVSGELADGQEVVTGIKPKTP
jgi:HlyD family secretion protein